MGEGQAVVDVRAAADNAEGPEDELEVARLVHGVVETIAATGEKPPQRYAQAGAFLGMTGSRVRRYWSLHVAPQEVKAQYLAGRITARLVEALQSLMPANQLIVLRRVLKNSHGGDISPWTRPLIEDERCKVRGRDLKTWCDASLAFENALLRASGILDHWVDAPRAQLVALLREAGNGAGRRRLVALIDEHISLLTTLRGVLEHGLEEKGRAYGGAAAVD